ncbi:MAG: phenylalanine--tRNA ligase subunit beta [Arsenophonus sp.]|nr:MAG: phenylalanine--tRNA ligase subunit beta [Arsenophonus sp.]
MKLSTFLLKKWIQFPIHIKQLHQIITMIGLEINNTYITKNKYPGIIIGEIIEKVLYDQNKKKCLFKVNIGKKIINVISNITKIKKNTKLAVATTESIFFNKIISSTINNQKSQGYLCVYKELEIYNKKNGIIKFQNNAIVGSNISQYLQIKDYIFEVNALYNRPDHLNILGITRDILAFLNKKPKIYLFKKRTNDQKSSKSLSVIVDNPEICPRFLVQIIKNIKINLKTPLWIKEILKINEILPVNPIQDICNYMTLEIGQPIEFYDLDKIEQFIQIKMAKNGEKFSLNNKENIILDKKTLIIKDRTNILSLAGICSGKHAKIRKKSKNILLIAYYLDPSYIYQTTKKYKLFTHISNRFERGVDYNIQKISLNKITELITNFLKGIPNKIIQIVNNEYLPKIKKILLTKKKINKLIGYYISNKKISKILISLQFKIIKKNKFWIVYIPSWRFDIKIEEDLIEEIIKIYGYNKIPKKTIKTNITFPYTNKKISLNRIKILLTDRGYHEVVSYSFVSPKIQKLLFPDEKKSVFILNPISKDMSVMRRSLLIGLITTLIYNKKRQENKFRFFESGIKFVQDKTKEFGIRQDLMISAIISGYRFKEQWTDKKRNVDFFDIKGDVESILELIGKLKFATFKPIQSLKLNPHKSTGIYIKEKYVGYLGMLSYEIHNILNLNQETYVFELYWEKMSDIIIPKFQEISFFPKNYRDISIIINNNISAFNILQTCREIKTNYKIKISIFDLFYHENIGENYKSISIRFEIQNHHKTLKEIEIDSIINKYIHILKEKFNILLRNKKI